MNVEYNIGQINIRSLKSNIDLLKKAILDHDLHIICLQEIWLKSELYCIRNDFELESLCREDGYGGVGIALKSHLQYERIHIDNLNPIEIIMIKLKKDNIFLHIASIYIPPNIPNTVIENKLNDLSNFLLNKQNLIICGDFNASDKLWDNQCINNTKRSTIIHNFINDNNLIILNSGEPTNVHYRKLSAIDLSLVSPSLLYNWKWEVHNEDCGSNHKLITLKHFSNSNSNNIISIFNKKCASEQINSLNFETFNSLEDYINETNKCVQQNSYTKLDNIKKQRNHWWTEDLQSQFNKKNNYLKLLNSNMNYINYINFKREAAKFKKMIKQAKEDSWTKFHESISPNTNMTTIWKKN